ncbi:MAG: thiamine phosphate synthase [Phycisphaeraceae bacterium]|nr:thiamine phosphate synthase [Phycisphaeraceae bacterium]
MPSVMRILDANANRAREALRVMEEAARFLLNDRELTEESKTLRHDLAGALKGLAGLTENRDTAGDVGTEISTAAEKARGSAGEVAVAAGKRLSEALRALEEYGKVVSAELAGKVEALRYRGYVLEQKLTAALGTGRARQWRLCVLLSAELCPGGDWLGVAEAAIRGGADCLQLREKKLEAGELLTRARKLVAMARPKGVSVMVNDRPDVALAAGADGVHLGQTDLPCGEARKLVGGQLLIGVSTANLEQARQAVRAGADYCGVGPMFASATKVKDTIAGLEYMRQFAGEFPTMPHLAISGIDAGNVRQVAAAGAKGVAVSSAVCGARDPEKAARELAAGLAES